MNHDAAHSWWSRLRHQGLLLSPVVMLERYPSAPAASPFYQMDKLRNAHTRFVSTEEKHQGEEELEQSPILAWVDTLLEQILGQGRLAKKNNIPDKFTAAVRIGTKSDTVLPQSNLENRPVRVSIACTEVSHEQQWLEPTTPPLRRFREGRHSQTASRRQGARFRFVR